MGILLLAYIAFTVIVFLFIAMLDVLHYLGRNKEIGKERKRFEPEVLVIIPCRGQDLTLQENLKSISVQKYPRYKVVVVVDDKSDVAISTAKSLGLDVLVAGDPSGSSSGKVNAILRALKRFRDYRFYVIADSDIDVDELWLSRLMAPMRDSKVGISTMFPYFNPVGGFWSKVKMVWGLVGETLFESDTSRFAWGGSLAFRRELIDKKFLNDATRSIYGVSDDILLTQAAKSRGLRIEYTKLSQPSINSDDDFRRFLEWSNRQSALTLLAYRQNLYRGIIYYSAEVILLVSGIVLSILVSPIFVVYLYHLVRNMIRTYARTRKKYAVIMPITILMPFIYLENLTVANRMRKIRWRGRSYPMK